MVDWALKINYQSTPVLKAYQFKSISIIIQKRHTQIQQEESLSWEFQFSGVAVFPTKLSCFRSVCRVLLLLLLLLLLVSVLVFLVFSRPVFKFKHTVLPSSGNCKFPDRLFIHSLLLYALCTVTGPVCGERQGCFPQGSTWSRHRVGQA